MASLQLKVYINITEIKCNAKLDAKSDFCVLVFQDSNGKVKIIGHVDQGGPKYVFGPHAILVIRFCGLQVVSRLRGLAKDGGTRGEFRGGTLFRTKNR